MATISLDCNGQVCTVEITKNLDGSLTFNVSAPEGFADARGLFFDFLDSTLDLNQITVSRAHATDSQFAEDAVSDLGNGASLNGSDSKTGEDLGKFDAGVEIGTEGIGKDDIFDTTLTIASGERALTIADIDLENIGLRLTSVEEPELGEFGRPTRNLLRTDSLKVILDDQPPPNTPPSVDPAKEFVYEFSAFNVADLAASGLGNLEALLGLDITASQTGNVVTYATSEGDLFKLALLDEGKWTFEIFQDAPFVALGLDLGALESGSPVEDKICTGQTGSGLDSGDIARLIRQGVHHAVEIPWVWLNILAQQTRFATNLHDLRSVSGHSSQRTNLQVWK